MEQSVASAPLPDGTSVAYAKAGMGPPFIPKEEALEQRPLGCSCVVSASWGFGWLRPTCFSKTLPFSVRCDELARRQ